MRLWPLVLLLACATPQEHCESRCRVYEQPEVEVTADVLDDGTCRCTVAVDGRVIGIAYDPL